MDDLKSFVKEKLKESRTGYIVFLIFIPFLLYPASFILHPDRTLALFGLIAVFIFIGLAGMLITEFYRLSNPETHKVYTSLFSNPPQVINIHIMELRNNLGKTTGFKINIITNENKNLEFIISKEEDILKFIKLVKHYLPAINIS